MQSTLTGLQLFQQFVTPVEKLLKQLGGARVHLHRAEAAVLMENRVLPVRYSD